MCEGHLLTYYLRPFIRGLSKRQTLVVIAKSNASRQGLVDNVNVRVEDHREWWGLCQTAEQILGIRAIILKKLKTPCGPNKAHL